MSRISQVFAKQKPVIGYLTAGDAPKERFLELLQMGVTILEIGIPFSDPVADGPVIQQAMQRSIKAGTNLETVLNLVKDLRQETDAAIVLFSYFNPIQRDLKNFLSKAKMAGADGILIVDLPLEESQAYHKLCCDLDLDTIYVIAPSTPSQRILNISKLAKGFIYYACRKGTTGTRIELPKDLREKITSIRKHTTLPIAVGFGIASREAAEAVLKIADGVVIGSHFVEGKSLDCLF